MKTTPNIHRDKPEYFAALDGFRGVLAVMIAIYHTMWLSHINSTDLFTNGPALVDIFFVFSGFLMFTLYDGQLNTKGEGQQFIKRRIARIYPLHFFMLIIALLYAFARVVAHWIGLATYAPGEVLPFQAGASDTLWSFLTNLTMTHSMGLHGSLSYNMPSWTVSVEFWTYFVFLAMMLWARPKKMWHFILIGMLVGLNYWALSTVKPNIDFHYDLGFFRCLGGFFTGVIVSAAYQKLKPKLALAKSKNLKQYKMVMTCVEIMAFAAMVIFVSSFPGKWQFLIAPIAFVFVLGFSFDGGYLSGFFGSRFFTYLGKISYSIYMIHVVISLFFAIIAETVFPRLFGPLWNATQDGGDLYLIPYLLTVLGLAHLTYHYVEVPGRKALMRFDAKSWRGTAFMFKRPIRVE